jgi:hypothetical protein
MKTIPFRQAARSIVPKNVPCIHCHQPSTTGECAKCRITITLTGPDAAQALAELESNIQYDTLNVTVTKDGDQ